MISPLLETCVDLVYPRSCRVCGDRTTGEQRYLCWDCLSQAEFVGPPFCGLCGDPANVASITHDYLCPFCTRQTIAFSKARSAVRYKGSIKEALLAFKYGGEIHLRHDLTGLLQGCFEAHFRGADVDVVLAVPMHARRERQRSYNQAQLLAEGLARYLGVAAPRHALTRIRDTGSQTRLNAIQRLRNVRNAFRVQEPDWIDGRRVLLCDDVMTTGATAAELARVLRAEGAIDVQVISVARG